MAKDLNEDTGFNISIKTLIAIGFGMASLMPYHYDDGSEFSYHNYIEDDQWMDYSGGLIYGIKQNKSLAYFFEGKYNKYWNREWYDFKFGINYVIF